MAAREVVRKLKVVADTSGMAKGAGEVQAFGRSVGTTAAALEKAKGSLGTKEYKDLAVALQPAIKAEREMAAELHKHEMAAMKAMGTSQKRVLSEQRAAEALRKTYDVAYRDAQKYAGVEEQVQRMVANRNLTVAEGNAILSTAATRFKQADVANDNFRGGLAQSDAALDRFRHSLGLTDARMSQMQTGFAGMAANLSKYRMLLAGAAGAAGLGGGFAITGIVETAAEFQKLEASLKTVTGSAGAAQSAMGFIQQFAAETPFDLQQVTEAFIRLKSLGLEPSRAALESYGNSASAMGKPLMQYIEAVADAVTGEMERLKEFGIRASKDGEQVSFTFQGITTTVGNSAREIEGYLRGIGEVQFAGAMLEQMKTLPGALSNAQDAIATFQNQIGKGGLADAVEDSARSLAAFLEANESLAYSIGSEMGQAIRDLNSVITDVSAAASWAADEVRLFGSEVGDGFATVASVVNGFAETMNGLFQAITGASSEAARLLPDGWDAAVREIHATISDGVQRMVQTFAAIPAAGHAAREALFGNSFSETFAAEQQRFVDAVNGAGSALGDALGFHVTLDEVVVSARDAANATADLRSNAEALAPAAAASAAAIDSGLTKPSREAEKALRDADAARRALFAEADAAVAEFFPFETAVAEAERLMAAVSDTSNGLTELQRQALRMQADQGFVDLSKEADTAGRRVRKVRDEFDEMGEIGRSAFEGIFDALSRGGNIFESFIEAFVDVDPSSADHLFDKLEEQV